LLKGAPAVMNHGIRHRLLTIVLLGVLTSALSVVALVQLLSTSTSHRVERAREAVIEDVDRLAQTPARLHDPTPSALIGMRAGIWTEDVAPEALAQPLRAVVSEAVARARAEKHRVMRDVPLGDATVIVAVRPVQDPAAAGLPPDSAVFAVFQVRPLPSLQTWQRIVALLVGATVLLVGSAVYSIVTVSRGAAGLRVSLDALASDLHAPVARPRVRELDEIADGIAGLAQKLADARDKQEKLSREIAQNERLAALGRVAAGVAHEVRNPLASIKLRLDLATASSNLAEPTAGAIRHATSEIERLDRLVADLLFVAGRAVGPKGKRDVGELVRHRADALAPWSDEQGIRLAVSGSGTAFLDTDAMARAIDNLLRNAVEASSSGGSVEARVVSRGDRVVIEIEDQGPGVPADRVSELFEPFFTTKPGGTGLGLAISRAIARAHGGDVLYARDGDVTRFSLLVTSAATVESEKGTKGRRAA
jgi:signal transduction histidine kinase